MSAQHTPGPMGTILDAKQAAAVHHALLTLNKLGLDGFKVSFPKHGSDSAHIYVDGAVTNKQLRLKVSIFSKFAEDNWTENFNSFTAFVNTYDLQARTDLTIEEINALPEADGWWPMGMNDRIVKLCRAVARAAIAKATGGAA